MNDEIFEIIILILNILYLIFKIPIETYTSDEIWNKNILFVKLKLNCLYFLAFWYHEAELFIIII